MTEKKYSISFTKDEINVLAHLTRHFCDYVFRDDRPDHGEGILKGYRKIAKDPAIKDFKELFYYRKLYETGIATRKFTDPLPKQIEALCWATGKLNRKRRKI